MKKKIFFVIILIIILIVGAFTIKNFGTKKVLMNEKAEGKNLVVTFTEFEKPIDDLGKGSYTMGGGAYEYTKPGYVNRLAHFTVDNVGKCDIDVSIIATLNYGDGYTFVPAKSWYHVDYIYNKKGEKIEGGSWVNSIQTLSPFDEPLECIIAFLIPEEVAEGNEEMSITFEFDGKKFVAPIK